jgi:hypothetical protein
MRCVGAWAPDRNPHRRDQIAGRFRCRRLPAPIAAIPRGQLRPQPTTGRAGERAGPRQGHHARTAGVGLGAGARRGPGADSGTKRIKYLEENLGALEVRLRPTTCQDRGDLPGRRGGRHALSGSHDGCAEPLNRVDAVRTRSVSTRKTLHLAEGGDADTASSGVAETLGLVPAGATITPSCRLKAHSGGGSRVGRPPTRRHDASAAPQEGIDESEEDQ